MQRIDVARRPIEVREYKGAFADERHVSRIVDGPAIVHVDGDEAPAAVYVELDERLPDVVAALRSVPWKPPTRRTRGLLTTSRTFGYAPKLPIRGEEACREARLAADAPEAHAKIAGLASVVEAWYRRLNPALYEQHVATTSAVLPEWRLGGGVFTSGIVNRNNKLPYHHDAGNFADCWSNMLVFKSSCVGGDLVCPELDLCFRLRDHSLLMFDGQSILHGVSPFRLVRPEGYRYTVVFYSLRQMWRCDAAADSVALARRRRTERERARFA